jgi:hypothetical protein
MASDNGASCLGYLIAYAIASIPGAIATQFLLWTFLQKDIPWYGDVIIGFFASGIAIPAAIVVWLLQLFGAL